MLTKQEALEQKIDKSLKELKIMAHSATTCVRLAEVTKTDQRKLLWNIATAAHYGQEITELAEWIRTEITKQ